MATEGGRAPLVSVVVPVHNAEQYLAQCLESVLGQSLGDLEVIAVDDASTDGSGGLLSAARDRDERLRVITFQRNRGVSTARNEGLAAATGEFVAFVDADDYLDSSMLEALLDAARALRCEVVACGIEVVDSEGKRMALTPFPLPTMTRQDGELMREHLHNAFSVRMLWYPFRSIYRRALLVRRGIRFEERVRKGEDSLFNLQALHHADGVASIGVAPYHYRKHGASATARALAGEAENLESLACAVLGFYDAYGYDDRARRDFYGHVLRSDLPTALVRLRNHPELRAQVRTLVEATVVRDAFQAVPLNTVAVPGRVGLLLVLARVRAVRLLSMALRVADAMSRRTGRTRVPT